MTSSRNASRGAGGRRQARFWFLGFLVLAASIGFGCWILFGRTTKQFLAVGKTVAVGTKEFKVLEVGDLKESPPEPVRPGMKPISVVLKLTRHRGGAFDSTFLEIVDGAGNRYSSAGVQIAADDLKSHTMQLRRSNSDAPPQDIEIKDAVAYHARRLTIPDDPGASIGRTFQFLFNVPMGAELGNLWIDYVPWE